MVTYVQVLNRPNYPSRRIKLKGLAAEKKYRIEENGQVYYGDTLMNAGIMIKNMWGDYMSTLIHLVEVG